VILRAENPTHKVKFLEPAETLDYQPNQSGDRSMQGRGGV
jgi:hypothetical protein